MSDGIAGGQVVGIDLHLHRSVICRIEPRATELGWVRIENDPKALVARVSQGRSGCAGRDRGDLWLVLGGRRAARRRFEVHLAHPLGLKAAAQAQAGQDRPRRCL